MVTLRKESQLPVIGRIVWMGAGPAFMAVCLVLMLNAKDSRWLTALDVLFAVALLLTIGGRWIEYRGPDPRTANYEPATTGQLTRYIIVTASAAIALWALLKLITVYWN